MNFRSLINKVLIGLRQTVIDTGDASTTDEYHVLVGQFVNEAKEEVEESWDWYALRNTVTVTLAAAQVDYTLTSAGDADTDTNDRSKLLYEKQVAGDTVETSARGIGSRPAVYDVTDASESRLGEISMEKMERLHFTDSDETGDPEAFAIYSDGTSLKMKVWPIPDAARTLKMRIYIPQDELDTATLDTSLSIPARPVWTRALLKANEERGSELGRPQSSLWNAAQDALSVAISREMRPSDYTSYPD